MATAVFVGHNVRSMCLKVPGAALGRGPTPTYCLISEQVADVDADALGATRGGRADIGRRAAVAARCSNHLPVRNC